MTYRSTENGRQFVIIAAGGHGRLGTDIGDSVVAFALPDSGPNILAQTVTWTLRTVGTLLIFLLALLAVFALAPKNWFWYPLLILLIVTATWVTWLITQTTLMALTAMIAAIAIAWLLTLGRKRLRAS